MHLVKFRKPLVQKLAKVFAFIFLAFAIGAGIVFSPALGSSIILCIFMVSFWLCWVAVSLLYTGANEFELDIEKRSYRYRSDYWFIRRERSGTLDDIAQIHLTERILSGGRQLITLWIEWRDKMLPRTLVMQSYDMDEAHAELYRLSEAIHVPAVPLKRYPRVKQAEIQSLLRASEITKDGSEYLRPASAGNHSENNLLRPSSEKQQ